jgi:hypothetical protein
MSPFSTLKSKPNEVSEVLAEIKGFAEDFKSSINQQPTRFFGVLVSGRMWAFPLRSYNNGSPCYYMSSSIDIFSVVEEEEGNRISINDESIKMVSKALVFMLSTVEHDLIEIINQSLRKAYLRPSWKNEEDFNDDHNEDDDYSSKGDDQNDQEDVTKNYSKSSQTAAGSTNTRVITRSQGRNSSKGENKTKNNSNISYTVPTIESMYIHDMRSAIY